MAKSFLLLGSNRGDREELLYQAAQLIHTSAGIIVSASSIYESAPWGFEDETPFLNQVVQISTSLSPSDLLRELLLIEEKLDRARNNAQGYQGRTMDIDILFYDDMVIKEPTLEIPHPRLHERMFTLLPLHEIAPDYVHPIFHKAINLLKESCTDKLPVRHFIDRSILPNLVDDEV